MAGLEDSNSTDANDNSLVGIMGPTGNTRIGNVGDRLKVDAEVTLPATQFSIWKPSLRIEDMNVTTGGIARNTDVTAAFQTLYSYSGSGYLAQFAITIETFNEWQFRLQVDGNTIFEILGSDLVNDQIYNLDDSITIIPITLGLAKGDKEQFVFTAPLKYPMYFQTSVVVSAGKATGGAKRFRAGLIWIQKGV